MGFGTISINDSEWLQYKNGPPWGFAHRFGREDFLLVGIRRLAGSFWQVLLIANLERHVGHPSGLGEAGSVDTPSSFGLDSLRRHDYIPIGFRAYVLNPSQPNSGLRVVFPAVRFCFLATSRAEVDHGTLTQNILRNIGK